MYNGEINIVQFNFTFVQKLSLHKKVEQLRNLSANTSFKKKVIYLIKVQLHNV